MKKVYVICNHYDYLGESCTEYYTKGASSSRWDTETRSAHRFADLRSAEIELHSVNFVNHPLEKLFCEIKEIWIKA